MRLRGEVFKFCPGFLAQCFISNIRNVSYRCSGFSRKYLSPHFEFSLFRGLMKGFSLLVFITGPPQCITPAHYVALHACYCITAQQSRVSSASSQGLVTSRVWARPGLETGDCPVNITIWQHGQQLRSAELVSFLRLGNTWQHWFILSTTGFYQ